MCKYDLNEYTMKWNESRWSLDKSLNPLPRGVPRFFPFAGLLARNRRSAVDKPGINLEPPSSLVFSMHFATSR